MGSKSYSATMIPCLVITLLVMILSAINSNVRSINVTPPFIPSSENGFFAFAYQVAAAFEVTAQTQNQSAAYNPSDFNRTRLASPNDALTPPVPTLSSVDIQRLHEIALNDTTVQHWIAIAHGNYTIIPGYDYGYSYHTTKSANSTNANTIYTFSNPTIVIRLFGKGIAIVNHITTASVLTNPNAIGLYITIDPLQNTVEKVQVGAVVRPSIEGTIVSDNSPFRIILAPFTTMWILGGVIGTASVVIYLKSVRKL